jgi:GT2 family glycosyltransferase
VPERESLRSNVAAIVVTWNSEDVISECLAAVTAEADVEVIVVDNGSADDTTAIVRKDFPDVTLVESGGNVGFAKACNLGLERTSGEHVLLLNPDARLDPGCLERLRGELTQEHVGACVPRLTGLDGETATWNARHLPSAGRTFARLVGLTRLPVLRRINGGFADRLGQMTVDVPCTTGAVFLVRRSVLGERGLDETMPMYLEDLELCARIAQLGMSVRYVGAATATHVGRHSSTRSARRGLLMAMEDGHAPWLYLQRFEGRFAAARYRAAALVGGAVRWLTASALALVAPAKRRATFVDNAHRQRELIRWALTSPSTFEGRIAGAFALNGGRS